MDAEGVAIIMGSLTAFAVGVGTIWVKIQELHRTVNSALTRFEERSKELSEAKAELARLKGEIEGARVERLVPMIPAIIPNGTILTKDAPTAKTKEVELTDAMKKELKAKAKAKTKAKRSPSK